MSRPSAGKEAVRLAKTLSSCSGVMAASRTRSPAPGRAEGAVMSGIGSAVAMVIQETHVRPTGGFPQSPIDRSPYGQTLLQGRDAGKRDEDHAGFTLGGWSSSQRKEYGARVRTYGASVMMGKGTYPSIST